MQENDYSILQETLLITQFLAALIGTIYLFKLKNSYWKWFSIYLIIIFMQEYFLISNDSVNYQTKLTYSVFFGVPLQYIFLYWLYALKSLRNKRLFKITVLIYIVTVVFLSFFNELYHVLSLTTNIGTIILIGLLILEFIKQIKTDDILNFRENKMFFINLGLVLFYIGSYPYQVFGEELYENHFDIWDVYHTYFLATNCIMYLLFLASFIWGKTQQS